MVRVAEPVADYMIDTKEGDLTGKGSSKLYGRIEMFWLTVWLHKCVLLQSIIY